MNVYFFTLGCKVNQYETQEMLEILEKRGHTAVTSPDNADVIVVNSCTVTAESVRKTRQTVRKLKKQNPESIIILTGCASQAEPQITDDLPDADIIMGNRTNTEIADVLENFLNDSDNRLYRKEHLTGDPFKGTGITRFDGHTRAFLKIQDGCDRFCSYCLIPTARGRSRSKPLKDIDIELKSLSENGFKEIVFVGINLSDYGKNTPYSLPDALMLAEKHTNIKRVRLGSLEPDHITDEMIAELKKVTKLCPQFHISAQSGSDSVLKAMNRHYSAAEYEELAHKLRTAFPDATITTDILVGFPTESEDNFDETVQFVKRVGFEKTHIFPYSVREGTRAAEMPQLTKTVKEGRAARLSPIAEEIRREFFEKQVGRTVEVLFETKTGEFATGYTENYTPVQITSAEDYKGKIKNVKITGYKDDFCIGEIV